MSTTFAHARISPHLPSPPTTGTGVDVSDAERQLRGKAVFAALKPVCIPLIEAAPHTERATAQLRALVALLPQLDSVGLAACFTYVTFPLTHMLKQSGDEGVRVLACVTLDALVGACGRIDKTESFVELFLFLLQLATRSPGNAATGTAVVHADSESFPLCEPVHAAVLHSLRVLLEVGACVVGVPRSHIDDAADLRATNAHIAVCSAPSLAHVQIRRLLGGVEFRLSLGFLTSHLLKCALPHAVDSAVTAVPKRVPLPRAMRCEALQMLLSLCTCLEQRDVLDDEREQQTRARNAAATMANFLPGITSTCVKIIAGDSKVGSVLVCLALDLLAACVSITLADTTHDSAASMLSILPPGVVSSGTVPVMNSSTDLSSLAHCLRALAELRGAALPSAAQLSPSADSTYVRAASLPAFSNELSARVAAFVRRTDEKQVTRPVQPAQITPSPSTLAVPSVIRDDAWLRSTVARVRLALERVFSGTNQLLTSTASLSQWRVRLHAAHCATRILCSAPLTLNASVHTLIEALVALALDEYTQVAQAARDGLRQLRAAAAAAELVAAGEKRGGGRSFLGTLLLDALAARVRALPHTIRTAVSEATQVHALRVVAGLIETAAALDLPQLCVALVPPRASGMHAHALFAPLLTLLHVDAHDTGVLERNTLALPPADDNGQSSARTMSDGASLAGFFAPRHTHMPSEAARAAAHSLVRRIGALLLRAQITATRCDDVEQTAQGICGARICNDHDVDADRMWRAAQSFERAAMCDALTNVCASTAHSAATANENLNEVLLVAQLLLQGATDDECVASPFAVDVPPAVPTVAMPTMPDPVQSHRKLGDGRDDEDDDDDLFGPVTQDLVSPPRSPIVMASPPVHNLFGDASFLSDDPFSEENLLRDRSAPPLMGRALSEFDQLSVPSLGDATVAPRVSASVGVAVASSSVDAHRDWRHAALTPSAHTLLSAALAPHIWRLATTLLASQSLSASARSGRSTDASAIATDATPISAAERFSRHALTVALALRLVAVCAAAAPRDFARRGVMRALHAVLEKVADGHPLVALSARAALESIARSCGFAATATASAVPSSSGAAMSTADAGVCAMVVGNADYLIDALSLRLRADAHSLGTPLMLHALLAHTGAPPAQLVPLLDDTIQLSIDAFDALLQQSATAAAKDAARHTPFAQTTAAPMSSSLTTLTSHEQLPLALSVSSLRRRVRRERIAAQLDAYLGVLTAFVEAVAVVHYCAPSASAISGSTQSTPTERQRTVDVMMPHLTPVEFKRRLRAAVGEMRDVYSPPPLPPRRQRRQGAASVRELSSEQDGELNEDDDEVDDGLDKERDSDAEAAVRRDADAAARANGASPAQLLVVQILRRVQTLLLTRAAHGVDSATSSQRQRRIGDLVAAACRALSSCENELLPALASLWQALRPRLVEVLSTATSLPSLPSSSSAAAAAAMVALPQVPFSLSTAALAVRTGSLSTASVTAHWSERVAPVLQTLDLLKTMAELAPRFLAQHFAKDVWPTLRALLKRERAASLADTAWSAPTSTSHVDAHWIDLVSIAGDGSVNCSTRPAIRSPHAQIQAAVFECVASVVQHPDMAATWIDDALASCCVYLDAGDAASTTADAHWLCACAVRALVMAALRGPHTDAAWAALVTYRRVHGVLVPVPVPLPVVHGGDSKIVFDYERVWQQRIAVHVAAAGGARHVDDNAAGNDAAAWVLRHVAQYAQERAPPYMQQ